MSTVNRLSDANLIVLALLSEGKAHGYELEKTVYNRGFRFWTNLGRSSIYTSLRKLENSGFVNTSMEQEGGPARKVFSITKEGLNVLREEGFNHLSDPAHWRSEIDLGLYSLPILTKGKAKKAIEECLENLLGRLDFISERLNWCQARGLDLPALSFERTKLMLEAEIKWLRSLKKRHEVGELDLSYKGWRDYEYKEPPRADSLKATQPKITWPRLNWA